MFDWISKSKKTKLIKVRNPKILKAVMFCDSNYSMHKETRKSISGQVATLGGKLLTCASKTQRKIM